MPRTALTRAHWWAGHRSVAISEEMAERLAHHGLHAGVAHRDVDRNR